MKNCELNKQKGMPASFVLYRAKFPHQILTKGRLTMEKNGNLLES